jgi:hypothetical protein
MTIDIGIHITMPPISLHREAINAYLLLMISHTLFTPFCDLEEACQQFGIDVDTIMGHGN